MRILRCEECAYERSSEDDGKMFVEDPLDPDKLICKDCDKRGQAMVDLMTTGKTDYAGLHVELSYDAPEVKCNCHGDWWGGEHLSDCPKYMTH